LQIVVISREEVRRRLTFARCIPAMRAAMIDLSAGRTRQTLRQIVPVEGGLFGVMQGALAPGAAFGAKVLSMFPQNVARGGQSHQGLILLFDPESGAPAALVHAGELTAIRTAAASAVATDALAPTHARRLAVLGTGEQAVMHAKAIAEVRPLVEVRIWGRSPERAAQAAEALQAEARCLVTPSSNVAEAVRDAEIICTTTSAPEPILFSRQVADGAHLNVVGSSYAGPAEIDNDLVRRARFFADHRESVLSQGAEFLRAKAAGLIGDDHILGEIGDVLAGAVAGRRSAEDVTLYKSLGNIVQDLAAAALLRRAAHDSEALPVIEF
jgi:ornithine cyclodeaminase/alanine dehydrogenase-like protein (mu-crystallin family)